MSGTILLADDSLTIQKVVELTFADTDYRVVAVSSGDDLLERLRDSQPDLIICDVIMPGKDGYEVCQEIKSSSDWLHLPVILLTGTFEPFDRDRAIAAGCSEIITKPFEARKLVDTVERLIGGAEAPSSAVSAAPPMADSGESWPEDATPVDVQISQEPEEFGTQLSPPEGGDDGLEFTTSGFAEMEAAGRKPSDPTGESESNDELEYEFSTPAIEPPVPEEIPAPDISAQTIRIDTAAIRDEIAPKNDEWVAPADAVPPEIAEAVSSAPETEPFNPPEEEPFAASAAVEGTPKFRDEPSMADTSPIDPPEEEIEAAEAPDEAAGPTGLSDDDVDRIARRVVELASDRLERVVWEVVPDMAEIVVRQRIRELEAESDASKPDTVQ